MAKTLGSKRGQYANLKATAGKKEGVWEVKEVPKPERLVKIDKERTAYNKQLDNIKQLLLSTYEPNYHLSVQKEQEENVTRWINKNIYKTKVKGKVVKLKNRKVGLASIQKLVNEQEEAIERFYKYQSEAKEKDKKEYWNKRIKNEKISLDRNRQILEYLKSRNSDIIDVKDLLKKGRKIYEKRKPLDIESKKIREKYNAENRAYKSLYDVIRYAKKNKRARVWINGKEFLASQITPTMTKAEKQRLQQLKKKKKLSTRRKVKTEDGRIVFINEKEELAQLKEKSKVKGYILPNGAISGWHIGATATFDVSAFPPSKKVLITKERRIKPAQDKIFFEQDSTGRLFTTTNIKLLFDKAEKQTGQRVIFINNQAMTEIDFASEKPLVGRTIWYVTPYAYTEIVPGVSDLSFVYNPSYILKTTTVATEKVQQAQKPILKELTSTIMIGGKNQHVHILIYTVEALNTLKEARARRKAGDNVSWLATQYTITENMTKSQRIRLESLNKKLEISLTDAEKAELAHLRELDKMNIVVEVQGGKAIKDSELLDYQNSHTEYVSLSWAYDKAPNVWIFGVAIKMNTEEAVAGAVEYVGA
ncbi:MAG: hypothetical protein QXH07_04630 [Thermoplasmata archaeon]